MLLDQWQFNQPVSLFVSDGTTEQEYRLTFRTMSAFDESKFRARRRKMDSILTELYGKSDERTPEQQEDANALVDILYRHAIIMSALAKVEMLVSEDWQETRLPESWYDPKEFAFNAPASVLDPLVQGVLDAGNPFQLFSFAAVTDDEKKALRLTVKPSTS